MARKTKEDTEATRQAILSSALQTFYEKGFSRTTFDEIAKRINLTKGAVYWHFRNKSDLITAIIRQKISEQEDLYANLSINSLAELRQAFIKRAEEIERDEELRQFLFFIIYRMEWSTSILDWVWAGIDDVCELPEKKLYDVLSKIKENGELKSDTDLNNLKDIIICFWRGVVNSYISGRKKNIDWKVLVESGFDIIISSIKAENK